MTPDQAAARIAEQTRAIVAARPDPVPVQQAAREVAQLLENRAVRGRRRLRVRVTNTATGARMEFAGEAARDAARAARTAIDARMPSIGRAVAMSIARRIR